MGYGRGPSHIPKVCPPALPATIEITTRASNTRVRRRKNLFATVNTSFLEPDVLERLCRAAVQHCRPTFVAPLGRQVALRNPRRSTVRGR